MKSVEEALRQRAAKQAATAAPDPQLVDVASDVQREATSYILTSGVKASSSSAGNKAQVLCDIRLLTITVRSDVYSQIVFDVDETYTQKAPSLAHPLISIRNASEDDMLIAIHDFLR